MPELKNKKRAPEKKMKVLNVVLNSPQFIFLTNQKKIKKIEVRFFFLRTKGKWKFKFLKAKEKMFANHGFFVQLQKTFLFFFENLMNIIHNTGLLKNLNSFRTQEKKKKKINHAKFKYSILW